MSVSLALGAAIVPGSLFSVAVVAGRSGCESFSLRCDNKLESEISKTSHTGKKGSRALRVELNDVLPGSPDPSSLVHKTFQQGGDHTRKSKRCLSG